MKKRIVAFMIIIYLIMGMSITAYAATGVRHYNDELGNIFLGGNYIEIGINKNGTFGTTNAPNSEWGFHFIEGKQSHGYYLGLIADGDGWDNGEAPVAGDFFTPGSPEERYIFSYKIDE